MKKILHLLILLGFTLFTGCSALSVLDENNIDDIPATNTPVIKATEIINEPPSDAPINLIIWVPSQFSPEDDEAGMVLQNQLDKFIALHPTVRIDTRVKTDLGNNGLLDSLYMASLAAPVSLPDLIAMPSQDLSEAVNLNLIIPFSSEDVKSTVEQSFDFARDFSLYNEEVYGIPFASELLIFTYRPLANSVPPSTWSELLQSVGPISFPGADVQSIVPLLLYQSQGGDLLNSEQTIALTQSLLKSVFIMLEEGSNSHLFPFWLTQYQTDSQAWQAISENRAQGSITWSRNYYLAKNQSIKSSAIPTKLGTPFTYGKGWMWSITNKEAEKQEILEELALFLSAPSFLGEWTKKSGYYPTTGNSLDLWSESLESSLAWQILPSAISLPDEELLNTIGGSLQIVIEKLLKQEIDANEGLIMAMSTLAP